jgi:hypothetical protein
MEPAWPLRVASHEVIPVELDIGWVGKVHLAERADPTQDAGPATLAEDDLSRGIVPGAAPMWRTRTLCGRARGPMVTDPGLDLLGEHDHLVCQSCWRTMEGWLIAPPPVDAEDDALQWVLSAVLETGEALLEGIPGPRFESFRRRARTELKAAIGGSVRTEKIGPTVLWVWSGLVHDAKTPEHWQEELRAAAQRMSDIEDGHPVEPPRWRRHWRDITYPG